MPSAREQYLQAMASLTEMTRTRAERLASRLAKQGELQSGQVGRFAEDLVRRTQRNRETMSRLVQREVKRQLSVLGIATRDEVSRLQQRVRALEQAVERPTAGRGSGGATGSRSGGSRTAGSTGGGSHTAASRGSTSSRSARSGAASSGGGRSSGGTSTRSGGTGSGRAAGTSSRTTRRSSSKSGPEESGSE